MYPQTVNAYFAPNLNEIVFPAAILQWPFFDPRADMAVNYAGIGSVIGHEITHGFDDKGSKFDQRGNLKNWWTAADRKRFEKKSQLLVRQANGQEVEPGVFINGTLTLGENIADLGGLVIGYEAYQKYLAKHGRKAIEGFSPEQRFFLGFAQMEREVSRPEFKKLAALTDPHAEASWRINCPLSNFEPFYKHFGLKKGDKLYRDSKMRAKIW
jgi:putative endopeptidase